jgi:hypothetical protein
MLRNRSGHPSLYNVPLGIVEFSSDMQVSRLAWSGLSSLELLWLHPFRPCAESLRLWQREGEWVRASLDLKQKARIVHTKLQTLLNPAINN